MKTIQKIIFPKRTEVDGIKVTKGFLGKDNKNNFYSLSHFLIHKNIKLLLSTPCLHLATIQNTQFIT